MLFYIVHDICLFALQRVNEQKSKTFDLLMRVYNDITVYFGCSNDCQGDRRRC